MLTHWQIDVIEDDTGISARITNMATNKSLDIPKLLFEDFYQDLGKTRRKFGFPALGEEVQRAYARENAIAELFAGASPNIRDNFTDV